MHRIQVSHHHMLRQARRSGISQDQSTKEVCAPELVPISPTVQLRNPPNLRSLLLPLRVNGCSGLTMTEPQVLPPLRPPKSIRRSSRHFETAAIPPSVADIETNDKVNMVSSFTQPVNNTTYSYTSSAYTTQSTASQSSFHSDSPIFPETPSGQEVPPAIVMGPNRKRDGIEENGCESDDDLSKTLLSDEDDSSLKFESLDEILNPYHGKYKYMEATIPPSSHAIDTFISTDDATPSMTMAQSDIGDSSEQESQTKFRAEQNLRHSAESGNRTWRSLLQPSIYYTLSCRYGSAEMKRQELIWELCETEHKFIRTMRNVLKTFAQPLKTQDAMWIQGLPSDVTLLFDWLDDIVHLHTQIYAALQRARSSHNLMIVKAADTFQLFIHKLSVYQGYIVRLSTVCRRIESMIMDNENDFGEFLRMQMKSNDFTKLPLSSFLLQPVQRITRYVLFFKQICQLTPPSHIDHIGMKKVLHATDIILRAMQEVKYREDEYELLKRFQDRLVDLPRKYRFAKRNRKIVDQMLILVKSTSELAPKRDQHSIFLTESDQIMHNKAEYTASWRKSVHMRPLSYASTSTDTSDQLQLHRQLADYPMRTVVDQCNTTLQRDSNFNTNEKNDRIGKRVSAYSKVLQISNLSSINIHVPKHTVSRLVVLSDLILLLSCSNKREQEQFKKEIEGVNANTMLQSKLKLHEGLGIMKVLSIQQEGNVCRMFVQDWQKDNPSETLFKTREIQFELHPPNQQTHAIRCAITAIQSSINEVPNASENVRTPTELFCEGELERLEYGERTWWHSRFQTVVSEFPLDPNFWNNVHETDTKQCPAPVKTPYGTSNPWDITRQQTSHSTAQPRQIYRPLALVQSAKHFTSTSPISPDVTDFTQSAISPKIGCSSRARHHRQHRESIVVKEMQIACSSDSQSMRLMVREGYSYQHDDTVVEKAIRGRKEVGLGISFPK